ncbi:MAG: type I DNA topoisomerase [bacterium]
MNLIIVESPTKAKTIAKFLGKEYKVESSFGHIRDLEKKNMGIDIKNNFKPKYIVPTKSKKIAAKLKDEARKADEVILAPDEDREGEAIAWHLSEILKLDESKTKRIVFHEITKNAITEALKNPRHIDMGMVDSQQARRILDRLVGFELSPFLWKKISYGLSAGRVQSVAVRLIVEREREIQAFKPDEYWTIEAEFNQKDGKQKFEAKLNKSNGKTIEKLEIKTQKHADEILKKLNGAKYIVSETNRKEIKKKTPSPFTTSTLQQTANNMLGFSAKQTMMIAQQLYEGLDLGGESGGLITYMRTDSMNLSEKFLNESQNYLKEKIGENYALDKPRRFKTKSKSAQEAHEAIRPTEVWRDPESLKEKLNPRQYRLYKLIWERTLASQMPEAIMDNTAVDIDAENTAYQFRANGQILKFDGYLKIYPEKSKETILPELKTNESLDLEDLKNTQHFTQPPGRYSDATLVKVLEQHGIGRPSTYAPTIATIESRNYTERDDNKKLKPTEIAFIVVDLLVKHFHDIIDYKFTAEMEEKLDKIADKENKWQEIIRDFYFPFHANLEKKDKEINKKDIMKEEKTKEICEKCESPMIIKTGRYGKFLACSNYPECKNIKSLDGENKPDPEKDKELAALREKYKNEVCEKCGSAMEIKNGKFGLFLACSGYPKCKSIKNIKENNHGTGIKCPNCEKGEIVQKKSRHGIFYGCDQYPECKTAFWGKPTGEKCPTCDALMIEGKNGNKCSNKECGK